jgi:polyisoprenyl-phosphate glycosyltransferase
MVEGKKIAVIIPAFNEEKTVAGVIQAAQSCSLVDEVVVVDDGSSDRTCEKAKLAKARVFSLNSNGGKGGAMEIGSQKTDAEFLLFIDADFINLQEDHFRSIINAVLVDGYDMSVGVVDRQRGWGDLYMDFFDYSRWPLSGTRMISRDLWEQIPAKYKNKFYVESAISYLVRKRNLKSKNILLVGVKHLVKEKKHGFWRGFFYRLTMTGQIVRVNIVLRFSKI